MCLCMDVCICLIIQQNLPYGCFDKVSIFRRDMLFCNILHNEKTQKYVCIIWRKIMASKGYFYDSDNDDQDDNNNLPFYYMH